MARPAARVSLHHDAQRRSSAPGAAMQDSTSGRPRGVGTIRLAVAANRAACAPICHVSGVALSRYTARASCAPTRSHRCAQADAAYKADTSPKRYADVMIRQRCMPGLFVRRDGASVVGVATRRLDGLGSGGGRKLHSPQWRRTRGRSADNRHSDRTPPRSKSAPIVREAFLGPDPAASAEFRPHREGQWLAPTSSC